MLKRHRSSGYSLVELSVAVALAGAVSLGALRLAPVLFGDVSQSRFTQRVSSWVLGIESAFLPRSDYIGLSLQSVADLGLLKDEEVQRDTSGNVTGVRHSYGGSVELGLLPKISNQFWGVHLGGVPVRVCVDVLQSAVQLGRVVRVVSEANGKSSFSQWAGNAPGNDVVEFPTSYAAVRALDGTVMAPSEMANFCGGLQGQFMGIALIRRKL